MLRSFERDRNRERHRDLHLLAVLLPSSGPTRHQSHLPGQHHNLHPPRTIAENPSQNSALGLFLQVKLARSPEVKTRLRAHSLLSRLDSLPALIPVGLGPTSQQQERQPFRCDGVLGNLGNVGENDLCKFFHRGQSLLADFIPGSCLLHSMYLPSR